MEEAGAEKHLAQAVSEISSELKRLRRAVLLNAKAVLTVGNDKQLAVTLAEVDTELKLKS